ncbi:hypothetical protein [Actinomycetospora chiangmaiensis]|uniref:hypothetical protein n=1 Tax=Actinomycetospora chiangmaiensis TaxID=402650 RepID=UPI000364A0F3|nr:hypothetical protein [Actinomycetospora chiangmaiensis]
MAELGVVAAYLAASLAFFHEVLGHLGTRFAGWVSTDASLFTWWLGWTPFALGRGLDPLTSGWQNAPQGVNGMWNTGVPLLAVLLAPVTTTAGPVVADNVAMILGPVASGFAAHRALATVVGPRWIRALAGLLYGFAPFVVGHAWVGHVNLVWMLFPPLVLWAVVRVLAAPRRPWLAGALLGLGVAAQMLVYTQTLALGAVALVVAALVLGLSHPRAAWRNLPAVGRSALAAVMVTAVLTAWPVWLLLRGPSRPLGPIREGADTGADAANLLVPSPLTAIRPGTDALATRLAAFPGEQGSYLGVAMLLVVAATLLIVRTRPVLVAVAVTAVLAVLSLGGSLVVLGTDTGIRLPWHVLEPVPLLGQAETGRFAPFVALGVLATWAMALEHLARRLPGTGALRRSGLVLAMTAVLAAGATWLPAGDQPSVDATSPAFFTAGAPGLAAAGGEAPVVELVPRPTSDWMRGGGDPLRWQAAAGFAFRQTGGYFIGGSGRDPVVHEGEVGPFQRGIGDGGRGDVAAARADLASRGVTAVVVVPGALAAPDAALGWVRAVTGRPGAFVGDVWLFTL